MTNSFNNAKELVAIGKIINSHGIQGNVKISIYNSVDSFKKNKLFFGDYSPLNLKIISKKSNIIICKIKGINSINDVDSIKNNEIFTILSEELNIDEYYHKDLIELKVLDVNRNVIGKITNVENFGASDLIEISFKNQKCELYDFSSKIFLEVNLEEKYVIFSEPEII